MPDYSIGYRDAAGKARKITLDAADEDAAVERIAHRGWELRTINALDPEEATDRQIAYLRDLGGALPGPLTKAEASDLIDNALGKRKPADDATRTLARSFGVGLTRFASKKAAYRAIVRTLQEDGRTADLALWYVYRVYRDRVDRSRVPTPPPIEDFRPIADGLAADPKFVASLNRAASSDGAGFRWFGEYTSPDGQTHTGESRRTYAYTEAAKRLEAFHEVGRAGYARQKQPASRQVPQTASAPVNRAAPSRVSFVILLVVAVVAAIVLARIL